MIAQELMAQILKEQMDRLEYLISEGRYDDAICIGEEFDEWIGNRIEPPT